MQRNRGKQRIGKIRDHFKKIRDTKGTFHAKMGSIKDRVGMDQTEAEDIKKRWQEYTEELYQKELTDPDLLGRVQEAPAEAWVSSGLLQGWGQIQRNRGKQ